MRNFKIDKTFQHIIFFAGGMFCFLLWAYLWFYDINGIQRKVFLVIRMIGLWIFIIRFIMQFGRLHTPGEGLVTDRFYP